MNIIDSIILGVVQGLTEFLPISSSGHLVLFQNLLGYKEPEILFDVALHCGTLLAVFIYFRSDLKRMITESVSFVIDLAKKQRSIKSFNEDPYVSLTSWVIIGTIPTALIGFIFKSPLESLFGSVTVVGVMLLVTGVILAVTKFVPPGYSSRKRVGLKTSIIVGIAQGLAIIPGVSRSGTTIATGILCGMERDLAARFSFLLSIPAILGAVVLQIDSGDFGRMGLEPLILGFISSALVGLLALKILMTLVRKGNFFYFAPYCWVAGLIIIFF
ncbi:undecaprenyl-diphosphate phosphatase [Thermodesulfobacteriota bacterium]